MRYGKGRHLSGTSLQALLVFIPFLTSSLQAQQAFPDQKITVRSGNSTILEVLEKITLQTGYYFTYNSDIVRGKQKVRYGVSDLDLKSALDSLFKDPHLSYRVIDRNIVVYKKNLVSPVLMGENIDRALLKGKVVDSRSGDPLPFATIGLAGTSKGSISNQEGGFSFRIPGNIKDPLLIVSFMGYRQKYFPVTYPAENPVTIEMEREMIPLQEVIIRYSDAEKMMQEALRKIPENYLDQPAVMTAFYRESVRRNDHCLAYSEAVLDVAKSSYSSAMGVDRVRIRKGRKITDVTEMDTVLVKLRSGIYTSLDLDVIKNRPDFLLNDFQERYVVEYNDLVTYGDRMAYMIRFRQKESIQDLLFRGEIYLDQETLAVVAVDFEFNPVLIQKYPDLFIISRSHSIRIRPVRARYHVEYRKGNSKYYVSQVRAELEMKVRKRSRWFSSRYRISIEMAITDVDEGRRLRIPLSERVPLNQVLSEEPFNFDPTFWGIYNTIEPEASLKESIQRIESRLEGNQIQ